MFRYYIIDTNSGQVSGTSNQEIAEDFASSDDYFVVDTKENMWLLESGPEEIPEYRIAEEKEEDE